MKHIPFLLSILILTSCQEDKKTDKIQEAVHSMFEKGWSQGDIASFEETVADSVLFHYVGSSQTLSRDQMSQFVIRWREAFPDLQMEIEEILVEDNLAATRLILTGTHEGSWAGAEPTGKQVTMSLMMFFRFDEGKMVELWEVDDQLGFRRQLGLIPD